MHPHAPTITFRTVSDTCDAEHGALVVRVSVVDSGGLAAGTFSALGTGAVDLVIPKSRKISGSEEFSLVRFSNASDSPKIVTIVTQAVDLSGNETSERRDFTVQPRCPPPDTSVGFLNADGFSEDFDSFAMMDTEVIIASANSLQPFRPLSFEIYQGSQILTSGTIDDCLNPMVCSGVARPGSSWSSGSDADRVVVRDRQNRAFVTWYAE